MSKTTESTPIFKIDDKVRILDTPLVHPNLRHKVGTVVEVLPAAWGEQLYVVAIDYSRHEFYPTELKLVPKDYYKSFGHCETYGEFVVYKRDIYMCTACGCLVGDKAIHSKACTLQV